MAQKDLILVTGATGYIGGRLIPALLQACFRVRVLARDPQRLKGRSWLSQVEVVQGDVLQPETLPTVLQDVDVAYYLIHSMGGKANFHEQDLSAAGNFSQASKKAGVKRIIYLGGLGDPQTDLSEHLKSRQDTGKALASAGVPVTEFRAAIIVGSGSISFEMIRYLTERIPIMICPSWVYTKAQPISIHDVIEYMVSALDVPESAGKIIEIGGSDVITYGKMMEGYAQVRGLKRLLIPVPVLTPRLSSYWVHWMTPVPASITRPLVEGLRNEVIVRDDLAQQLFPDIKPANYTASVTTALRSLDLGNVETRWTDALASSQGNKNPLILKTLEGMIIERRKTVVDASPETIFAAFTSLGGDTGWLYLNWAWEIRGLMDRAIGGVGLRRGRRDANNVRIGDAIDFWRVEALEEGSSMRLRAEMKVPGKAWLQFETNTTDKGEVELVQTAFFAPKGLSGQLYWYALYPLHSLIFSGLIKKLKLLAESKA